LTIKKITDANATLAGEGEQESVSEIAPQKSYAVRHQFASEQWALRG
jgi:hypothetical protein